jgi:hypothetical protein
LIWETRRDWKRIYRCTKSNFTASLNETRTCKIKATCFLWCISLIPDRRENSESRLVLAFSKWMRF